MRSFAINVVAVISLQSFAKQVSATSQKDVGKLLFADYDKDFLPAANESAIVSVYARPTIYALLDVEEARESITFLYWMSLYWEDQFLHWDPEQFGGIETIFVPASKIWTPDIQIFNTVQAEDDILPDERNIVEVRSNGRITMGTSRVFTVKCKFDVRHFPFDTQNCSLKVGSWGHQSTALNVDSWFTDTVQIDEYQDHPEWDLLGITPHKRSLSWYIYDRWEPWQELTFTVTMKRRPQFYIYVLVLPTWIITAICIAGLFTPSSSSGERSERVTLGLTSLLTLAVVLQIVSDQVPKISVGIPLLEIFVLMELVCCATATLVTVVVISVHQRALVKGWKPPYYQDKQTDRRQAISAHPSNVVASLIGKVHAKTMNNAADAEQSATHSSSDIKRLVAEMTRCSEHLRALQGSLKASQETDDLADAWASFFNGIDTILLIVFTLINVLIVPIAYKFYL